MKSIKNALDRRAAKRDLPWYVTGTLDEGRKARVREQVETSDECREALALERALAEIVASQEEVSGPAHAPVVAAQPERRRLLTGWQTPAVALGAACAVALLFVFPFGPTADYETLTSPDTAAECPIRVLFEEGRTAADVEAAASRAGASIVGGPSAAGVWSLAPADCADRDAAVGQLADDPAVDFVEQAQ